MSQPLPGLTRHVLHGIFWTFLGTGTQQLLRLMAFIVLARLLSPHDFGVVGAALVVIGLSTIFSQVGVGPAIVQRPVLEPRHLRVGFTISLALSASFMTLIWSTAPLIAWFFRIPELAPVVRVLALVFVCQGAGTIAEALAQRELRFRWLAGVEVVSFAGGFGLVSVPLAWLGLGVWALVYGQLAESLIKTTILLAGRRHPKRLLLEWQPTRELLYFGGGFTLAKLGNYLALQGDNVVVGRWLGPQALGLYGQAYNLMTASALLVGQVLDRVLFPAMARVQSDLPKLRGAYRRGAVLVALVTLPGGCVLYLLAPELILLLLGPKWAGAVAPFQILSLGLLFRASYKLSDSVSRATGAVYRRAWRQGIYAMAVLAGAWVGQHWGIAGVAWGVVAAICLNFLLMAQLSLKLICMSWLDFAVAHLRAVPLTAALGGSMWVLVELSRSNAWPAPAILAAGAAWMGIFSLSLCLLWPGLFLGPEGRWLVGTLTRMLDGRLHRRVRRVLEHAGNLRP